MASWQLKFAFLILCTVGACPVALAKRCTQSAADLATLKSTKAETIARIQRTVRIDTVARIEIYPRRGRERFILEQLYNRRHVYFYDSQKSCFVVDANHRNVDSLSEVLELPSVRQAEILRARRTQFY